MKNWKNVGDEAEAQKCFKPILQITPTDEMDQALMTEARELLENIKLQVITFLNPFK